MREVIGRTSTLDPDDNVIGDDLRQKVRQELEDAARAAAEGARDWSDMMAPGLNPATARMPTDDEVEAAVQAAFKAAAEATAADKAAQEERHTQHVRNRYALDKIAKRMPAKQPRH